MNNVRTLLAGMLVVGSMAASCTSDALRSEAGLLDLIPVSRHWEAQFILASSPRNLARSLLKSDDPVSWLDIYWEKNDPTPSSSANEFREVINQRYEGLAPDASAAASTPNELIMIKLGLPDYLGPAVQSWSLFNAGEGSTFPELPPSAQYSVFGYYDSIPPMRVSLTEISDEVRDYSPPNLERCLEVLEQEAVQEGLLAWALSGIVWYELPQHAQMLLELDPLRYVGQESWVDQAMMRMAVRLSYRLQEEGLKAISILRSAGAPGSLVLRRVVTGRYDAEQLTRDLRHLEESGRQPEIASLSLDVWRGDSARLLDRITVESGIQLSPFPWGWDVDASLSLAPPAQVDRRNWRIHLLWPSAAVVGVEKAMLGLCQSRVIMDPMVAFHRHAAELLSEKSTLRARGHSTLRDFFEARSEAAGPGERSKTIELLGGLAPLPTYDMGIGGEDRRVAPLSLSATPFRSRGDSIEVAIGLGIPVTEFLGRRERTGSASTLQTSLTIRSLEDNRIALSLRRDGYQLRRWDRSDEYPVLVDAFTAELPKGEYSVYASAYSPATGRLGGVVTAVTSLTRETQGLTISSLLPVLAVSDSAEVPKFSRHGHLVIPSPYGFDSSGRLRFYFEIDGLELGIGGQSVWREAYHMVPDDDSMGVITLSNNLVYRTKGSITGAYREVLLDETQLVSGYLVVEVEDISSGTVRFACLPIELNHP